MEAYRPGRQGCHTVRITLQSGEYLGHIAYRIGGNCMGMDVMQNPFEMHTQDDIALYPENDCKLEFHEDSELYTCTLVNGHGDEMNIMGSEKGMRGITVAMEIVAYKPESGGEEEDYPLNAPVQSSARRASVSEPGPTMKLNDIVYFYYDNVVPCIKGRLGVGFEYDGKKYFTISHLNDDNKPIGTSNAPEDHIFDTQEACMDYAESMGAFDEPAPTVCRCSECVYHQKRCSGLVKLDTGAFWSAGGCMNGARKGGPDI